MLNIAVEMGNELKFLLSSLVFELFQDDELRYCPASIF